MLLARPDHQDHREELEKLDFQEKRILDAYRESVISLDELKEQKAKIAANRKVLEAKIDAAQSQQESSRPPEITMEMLGDISARYHKVMAKADFATKKKVRQSVYMLTSKISTVSEWTKEKISGAVRINYH